MARKAKTTNPDAVEIRAVMRMFKLTEDEYMDMNEEGGGLCIACGEQAFNVEPDARKYTCESCGERGVYGVEELMIRGQIEIVEESVSD